VEGKVDKGWREKVLGGRPFGMCATNKRLDVDARVSIGGRKTIYSSKGPRQRWSQKGKLGNETTEVKQGAPTVGASKEWSTEPITSSK